MEQPERLSGGRPILFGIVLIILGLVMLVALASGDGTFIAFGVLLFGGLFCLFLPEFRAHEVWLHATHLTARRSGVTRQIPLTDIAFVSAAQTQEGGHGVVLIELVEQAAAPRVIIFRPRSKPLFARKFGEDEVDVLAPGYPLLSRRTGSFHDDDNARGWSYSLAIRIAQLRNADEAPSPPFAAVGDVPGPIFRRLPWFPFYVFQPWPKFRLVQVE